MTKLFKAPKVKKQDLPEPEPVTPLPDEEALAKTRKRAIRREVQTQGSPATLLSTGGGKETLGA